MEAERDLQGSVVQLSTSGDAKEKASMPTIESLPNENEYLVDFEGDDDPQNPLNWSRKRKWAIVAVLTSATFVSILGTSMCTPAAPQILADFHSDKEIFLTLLVSVWELGEAVGPCVIGPLSEIYGRLPIYHTTNLIFIVISIACAVSSSLNMLLAFRFMNGLGVAAIALNSSVIGDLFIQEERAGFFAIMALPALSGVAFAPVIGGYVGENLGWRWIFWITAMVGTVCEASFVLVFRESYKVRILKKKAERIRKETGNLNYHSMYDSNYASRYQLFAEALVRPPKIVVKSPIVAVMALYFATVYGYMYLITTTMTQVFEEDYGVSEGTAGLMFLGRAIGSTIGITVCKFTMDRHIVAKKATPGGMKPEHRLPPMIAASIAMPIGLFLYGWGTQFKLPWIVPVLGTGFVGISLSVTTISVNSYLVDAFSIYAASAVAACVVSSCIAGALLPMAGPPLYAQLGLGWGNSVLAFIAIAFIPVPLLLMKFGERARNYSKFAVSL